MGTGTATGTGVGTAKHNDESSVPYLAKDATQLFLQLISEISSYFSVVLLAAAMLSATKYRVSCRNTFKTETCRCWDRTLVIVEINLIMCLTKCW